MRIFVYILIAVIAVSVLLCYSLCAIASEADGKERVMIIKTVQTLMFEYPEDYQAEIEWNKKRDGDWVHQNTDWVHQSTDTMCSVYTLTNSYLIPTKAKHSFLDNPHFEAEQTERSACDTCQWYNSGIPCGVEPSVCKREVEDEPQTDCAWE